MLMYNNSMGIVLDEERHGFTIIEVMLFLALSGFLMVGILAGTGSSIDNQRYKDSVQDAVNILRNAYSFVADTEVPIRDTGVCGYTISSTLNLRNGESGRGRTGCAVYGAVVSISKDTIQTTTLIGRDYYDFVRELDNTASESDKQVINNPSSTDLQLLTVLQANNLAYECDGENCSVQPVGKTRTDKLKWGAYFKNRVTAGSSDLSKNTLQMTLLIYRSPRNGAIRTLVMDDALRNTNSKVIDYTSDTLNNPATQGVYKSIKDKKFTQKDVYFCISNERISSYANHSRAVRIIKNAHSQSGIVLLDMDAAKDQDGKDVLCE